jgi:cellulose biosynthesis protein BcsQ
VHNIAFALADEGKKVLLIDADPQMNLTSAMYGLSTSIDYSTDNTSKWSKNTDTYISFSEYLKHHLRGEVCTKEKFRSTKVQGT